MSEGIEEGVEVACGVRVITCATFGVKAELSGWTVKGEKVGTLIEGGEIGDAEGFDAEEVKVARYNA